MVDFDKLQRLATEDPFTKPSPEQLELTFKKIKRETALAEQLGTCDPDVIEAMAKILDEEGDGSDTATSQFKPSFSNPFGLDM